MGFEAETDVCPSSSTPMPCERLWFLAYTRPRLERVALHNLEQQGFEGYLPLYRRLKNTGDAIAAVSEPMFPRYVFFRPTGSSQSIAPVRSTRGVAQVVSFGHEMATIDSDTLNAIRQLEQARDAVDVIQLSSLRPGQMVHFCSPALKGLEGLVKSVSSRRVAVLLDLLGRRQLVNVDRHQLQEA